MNAARPTTERGFDRGIMDPLFAPVQIARAARGQDDSRSRSCLNDPKGAGPEGDERREPPPAARPAAEQRAREAEPEGQQGDSKGEPLPPLPRADVYDWVLVRGSSLTLSSLAGPRGHGRRCPHSITVRRDPSPLTARTPRGRNFLPH